MARLRNVVRVSAPPEAAWAIVGDLDGVARWIPGVTVCRIEGTRRICNNGEIEEEISDYSHAQRSYRYRHIRVPLPLGTSQGSLSVEADGSSSVVIMDAEIEALDPAQEAGLLPMIDGYYKQALESLRRVIEASVHGGAAP
jgi:hypothetical protein